MKLSKLALASGVALALGMTAPLGASNAIAADGYGFFFNADYLGTGDGDIEGTNSELSTQSYGFNAGYKFITVMYNTTEYDFSGGSFDPFDQLNSIAVDLHHSGYITSNVAYSVGINVGSKYEDSIEFGDDYSVSPRVAIGWTFNNGLAAFFGAYANFNGADNVYLPILGLKLGDEADHGWMGSIAYPATMVQYRFNNWLAVHATFLTVRDTFHLDDDSSKGSWADGYFREESYGAGIGATLNPMKNIKLSAGVMSYFDREFKVYNNGGDEIASFETDNSVGAYVRAGLVF